MLSLPIGLYPKKREWSIIGNYEDYQKLPANKKYLMPLIQTNNGLYIRWGAIFFTSLKEFKHADTIILKSQHSRTITIPSHELAQLRRKCKNFCLTLFDGGAIEIQQQPSIKTISNTIDFMPGQNFGLVGF